MGVDQAEAAVYWAIPSFGEQYSSAAHDIAALFEGVEEVTEAQLGCRFDELSAFAAEQPNDEVALSAIRTLVFEAHDRGYVNQAMQMAMTLGAMACTHNHMQGLANEVSDLFTDMSAKRDEKDNHDHTDSSHDAKTCKDCLAGRPCRRKH